MDVFRATSSDIPLLLPLFERYLRFYEEQVDVVLCQKYLVERIEKEEAVVFIVVEEQNGIIVALAFSVMYVTFSTIGLKKFWSLYDLYVEEEYRKQGIAKTLIDKCKELAAEDNPIGVVIESRISNQSAHRLFDSVGFVKEGEHYFYYLEN
jgi:ribosomal protein S18 acetylase RimI-like enzyme